MIVVVELHYTSLLLPFKGLRAIVNKP